MSSGQFSSTEECGVSLIIFWWVLIIWNDDVDDHGDDEEDDEDVDNDNDDDCFLPQKECTTTEITFMTLIKMFFVLQVNLAIADLGMATLNCIPRYKLEIL